jgi:hypothetical protein
MALGLLEGCCVELSVGDGQVRQNKAYLPCLCLFTLHTQTGNLDQLLSVWPFANLAKTCAGYGPTRSWNNLSLFGLLNISSMARTGTSRTGSPIIF